MAIAESDFEIRLSSYVRGRKHHDLTFSRVIKSYPSNSAISKQMRSLRLSSSRKPFICQDKPLVCGEAALNLPLICFFGPLVVTMRKEAGFTLIELMVTLVIAAILMMIAGPSLSTFIANQRISGQANDLLTDLNYARSEAVKRAQSITVCKTSNPNVASPVCNATNGDRWTAGRLIFVDDDSDGVVELSDGNGILDAGEQVLKIRQEIDGAGAPGNIILGFGDNTGTANRISYFGNGATHLTAQGELLSCDRRGDAYGLAVAIQTTGRARVAARGKDKDGNNITACP